MTSSSSVAGYSYTLSYNNRAGFSYTISYHNHSAILYPIITAIHDQQLQWRRLLPLLLLVMCLLLLVWGLGFRV